MYFEWVSCFLYIWRSFNEDFQWVQYSLVEFFGHMIISEDDSVPLVNFNKHVMLFFTSCPYA